MRAPEPILQADTQPAAAPKAKAADAPVSVADRLLRKRSVLQLAEGLFTSAELPEPEAFPSRTTFDSCLQSPGLSRRECSAWGDECAGVQSGSSSPDAVSQSLKLAPLPRPEANQKRCVFKAGPKTDQRVGPGNFHDVS